MKDRLSIPALAIAALGLLYAFCGCSSTVTNNTERGIRIGFQDKAFVLGVYGKVDKPCEGPDVVGSIVEEAQPILELISDWFAPKDEKAPPPELGPGS